MKRALYTTDLGPFFLLLGWKNETVEVELLGYDGEGEHRRARIRKPLPPGSPLAILSGRKDSPLVESTVPAKQITEIDAEA